MLRRRIEPVAGPDFDEWYGVYARSVDLSGFGTRWKSHEIRARAAVPDAPVVGHLLTFSSDGSVVAVAFVEQITVSNRRSVRTELHVDPPRRRHGYGSRALESLEEYVAALNHAEIVVSATEGSGEAGAGPSRHFAPHHGYVIGDAGRQRVLSWPRPSGQLDALEREWAPWATEYELESFEAPTPDRWRAERVRMRSMMSSEAPHVNQVVEEEEWTDEILAHYEGTTLAMGRDMLITVARHGASRTLAGYSELVVSREDPTTAFQYDTLVVRDHRGHRLGGLMKVANMRALERRGDAVEVISSFNSDANTAMIAVNEALGTETRGARIHWRKTLAERP